MLPTIVVVPPSFTTSPRRAVKAIAWSLLKVSRSNSSAKTWLRCPPAADLGEAVDFETDVNRGEDCRQKSDAGDIPWRVATHFPAGQIRSRGALDGDEARLTAMRCGHGDSTRQREIARAGAGERALGGVFRGMGAALEELEARDGAEIKIWARQERFAADARADSASGRAVGGRCGFPRL